VSAERNLQDANIALHRPHRLREHIAKEMRRFLVLFLYPRLLFGLFVRNERVIQTRPVAGSTAIYLSLACMSLLFTVLFTAFHVAEEMVVGLVHG
jgi:hypothetical protein